MKDRPAQNPYAPPEAGVFLLPSDVDLATESPEFKRRSWLASWAIWSLVCSVSAVPSFVWGLGSIASNQALAMLSGVLIFIGVYVGADQLTQASSWRRNRSLRLALKIGYIMRLAISVIFPVGGMLDMLCGMISISFTEYLSAIVVADGSRVGMGTASFGQVLVITLVQGVVLNVVLAAFVVLVFGIVLAVRRDVK